MISGICNKCKKIDVSLFDVKVGAGKYFVKYSYDCFYCKSPMYIEVEGSIVSGKYNRPIVKQSNNVMIKDIWPVIIEKL